MDLEIPPYLPGEQIRDKFQEKGVGVFILNQGICRLEGGEITYAPYENINGWEEKTESHWEGIFWSFFIGVAFAYGTFDIWSSFLFKYGNIIGLAIGIAGVLIAPFGEKIRNKIKSYLASDLFISIESEPPLRFPIPSDDEKREYLYSNLITEGEGKVTRPAKAG